MGDFTPKSTTLGQKLVYMAMTIVRPQKIARIATDELGPHIANDPTLDQRSEAEMLLRLILIRSSFLQSLFWIVATAIVGYAFGRAAWHSFGDNNIAVLALATAGGLVLFGATMGVQGWDIQSMDGNTLPERINQWIFRTLTLLGTLLAVISGSWAIGQL